MASISLFFNGVERAGGPIWGEYKWNLAHQRPTLISVAMAKLPLWRGRHPRPEASLFASSIGMVYAGTGEESMRERDAGVAVDAPPRGPAGGENMKESGEEERCL